MEKRKRQYRFLSREINLLPTFLSRFIPLQRHQAEDLGWCAGEVRLIPVQRTVRKIKTDSDKHWPKLFRSFLEIRKRYSVRVEETLSLQRTTYFSLAFFISFFGTIFFYPLHRFSALLTNFKRAEACSNTLFVGASQRRYVRFGLWKCVGAPQVPLLCRSIVYRIKCTRVD